MKGQIKGSDLRHAWSQKKTAQASGLLVSAQLPLTVLNTHLPAWRRL